MMPSLSDAVPCEIREADLALLPPSLRELVADAIASENARRGRVLNAAKVRAIRRMRAEGTTLYAIAAAVGCSYGAVSHVVAGRSWTHVE